MAPIEIMLWISFVFSIYTIQNTLSFNFESDESIQAIRNTSISINKFSFDLHKVISNSTSKNFVASPLSAAMVLMMAAYGARGENAEEMNSVLHFDSNNTIYRAGINSLIEMFNAIETSEVKLANKMYAAAGMEIESDYANLIETIFNSSIENVKFENSAETAKEINEWCAEQTHQRIEKIIDPSDIGQQTVLVLINAVYLKALWSSAFEGENTHLKTFHLNELETKEVPMMFQSIVTTYGVLPELGATFVRLNFEFNYEYEYLSMIIILPNKIDGLRTIENDIHKLKMSHFEEGQVRQVDLTLPKFKVESEIDLQEELMKLGLVTAFHDNADFSGICKSTLGIKIDKIVQKVVFEVNEQGIEAAAVTESILEFRFGKSQNPNLEKVEFLVDRPFLTLIANKDTVLFSGHIVDV